MRYLLPLAFIVCVSCDKLPPASTETVLTDLQQTQRDDRNCFVKFDAAVAKIWGEKLNETYVNDLGVIPKTREVHEPKKPKYNTAAQEWLMEDANPAKKLRECSAKLLNGIDNATRICVDELFERIIKEEENYADLTKELFSEDKNIPPLGKFLTFDDVKFVLFQNREVDNLTDHEKSTFGHIESYVTNDEDKRERTWILRQECDWNDLRDISEARDDQIPDLFRSQVFRAVDTELGNQLVRHFDLSANVTRDDYNAWVRARDNMKSEVETIVAKLKSVKNDTRWICEYANEIGNRFAVEQARILLPQTSFDLDLKVRDVANRAEDLERYLEARKDNRTERVKALSDGFGADLLCLESVATMIIDQQRYKIALSFIGEGLSYPEIFCRQMNLNLGLLAPEYCKCVGSFCVSHDIAALFAERFELKKNDKDGNYAVGITNVNKPTKKVVSWPGNKEI